MDNKTSSTRPAPGSPSSLQSSSRTMQDCLSVLSRASMDSTLGELRIHRYIDLNDAFTFCPIPNHSAKSVASEQRRITKLLEDFELAMGASSPEEFEESEHIGSSTFNNPKHIGFEQKRLEELIDLISIPPSPEEFDEAIHKENQELKVPMRPRTDKKKLERAIEKFKVLLPTDDMSSSLKNAVGPVDDFSEVYYKVILPYLQEYLRPRVEGGQSIGVKEPEPGNRVIEIVTHKEIEHLNRLEIGKAVAELLPEPFRNTTILNFVEGEVRRTEDEIEPPWRYPRNAYRYTELVMGDSIGSKLSKNTATAGPLVEMNGRIYRVNCWHLWKEHYAQPCYDSLEDVDVCYPSRDDLSLCLENEHTALQDVDLQPTTSGYVRLASGHDITTTRTSNDPYRLLYGKSMVGQCIMDWTIASESEQKQKPNVVRMVDVEPSGESISITKTSQVKPRSLVYSVGRSSGPQLGRVNPTLTWMNGEMNGTGKDTYEWSIEQLLIDEGTEAWALGGTGIPGDSGAAIINAKDKTLCGVVWGCTTRRDKSRVAHFSAWSDVADDICDKHPQHFYPTLPQYDNDPVGQLSEPICDDCADDRAKYLEEAAPILNCIHELGVERASTGIERSSTASNHSLLHLETKEPKSDLSWCVSESSTNTTQTEDTSSALLDNGSSITLISRDVSEAIDLQKPDENQGARTQRSCAGRPTARKAHLTVPWQKNRGRSASQDSGYFSSVEVEDDTISS